MTSGHYTIKDIFCVGHRVVHGGDFSSRLNSAHADIPYRKGELLVKRKAITDSLDLYFRKGLVDKRFGANGITYGPKGKLTKAFLNHFESYYETSGGEGSHTKG